MQARQVRCRPHDWHLEEQGQGRDLLLLHGTGASCHSWQGLAPLLAQTFRVICVDLPGHGQTRLGSRMRSSLDCISQDLAALCAAEGFRPAAIVGHSAGAAIALRLAHGMGDLPVIGINPALQPFHGLAGVMFPVAARMMAMTPGLVTMLVPAMKQTGRIDALLDGTGSRIPQSYRARYKALFGQKSHVEGAMLMMSQWKLDGLLADLPKLPLRSLFLTGSQDAMVPPISAVEAADQMPQAKVQSCDGYGHLLHEEAPELVARLILSWLDVSRLSAATHGRTSGA